MQTTRLFFDTEFTELSVMGKLISLAFVSDGGDVFYAEFNDFSKESCSKWLKENVISKLLFNDKETHFDKQQSVYHIKDTSNKVADAFRKWISSVGPVEIYSDCHAFDWVFFCNMFGSAFDIPKEIFYIPFDLATILKFKGIDPDISREDFVRKYKGDLYLNELMAMAKGAHNSLFDALLIRDSFDIIESEMQED